MVLGIVIFVFFSFFNAQYSSMSGVATLSLLRLASQQTTPTKKNNPEVNSVEGKSNVLSKTSTLQLSTLHLCTHATISRRGLLLCGGTVRYPDFLYDCWPISNTAVCAACGERAAMSGNNGDFLCPQSDPRGDFFSLVLIVSLWNLWNFSHTAGKNIAKKKKKRQRHHLKWMLHELRVLFLGAPTKGSFSLLK